MTESDTAERSGYGPRSRITRTAAATGGVVQLASVAAVLALGVVSNGATGDQLGASPLAAVYGLPAVLGLLALRGRGPLLLPAGIASLVLAVFPFSLHSFVFGPVGLIYLVAYAAWPDHRDPGSRSAIATLVVPALILAAFLVLIVHDDPICYRKHASGEIVVDRDPGPRATSGSQTIEADSDVVERGCSSDTVVWWEAAASLALSAGALATALALVEPASARTTRRSGPDRHPRSR